MRYTVKVAQWIPSRGGFEIINESSYDEIHEAINKESELRQIHGHENVWIADAVQEIMVG